MTLYLEEDTVNTIKSIEEMENCIYANNHDLNSYDVIGISDLVISAPISSVISEALCGGIKTISYDPLNQYGDYDMYSKKFPKFNAIDFSELTQLVDYWIYNCKQKDFDFFIDNYVRPNLDKRCCENSMIGRFKEALNVTK
jgi:polysaccharide biosynthesis PFTS motif protein